MKLHLPKSWLSVVLAACMAYTAQAATTVSNPYSITLEDGTTSFTEAAEIPGDEATPATPAVTLRILTCDNANADITDAHTGATYTVLAGTATSGATRGKGRFYIDNDEKVNRINKMGTLIIANGSYITEENGGITNFYGGQLKLVEKAVSNDIIIGSETYSENWGGATDEQIVGYSAALQLTNASKLTGKTLTLVANSQVGIEGSNSKGYIENTIIGEGKSLDLLATDSNNTIYLSGGANLKTLGGAANVVLDDKKSNNSAAAAGTSYVMNNITGTGAMTIDSGVTLTLLGDITADGDTVKSTKNIELAGTLRLGDDSDTQRYIILSGNVTKSGSPDILIRKKVDIAATGSISANKIKFGEIINGTHVCSEATLRIKNGGSLAASQDLDMANGTTASNAKVIFESGSTGNVEKLWISKYSDATQTYIDIEKGASLTLNTAGVTISGTESETAARIIRKDGSGGQFTVGSSDFSASNAKIKVDKAGGATVGLNLSGTYSLENAISQTVTENNSANTNFASVAASAGSITFLNKGDGMSIGELSIAGEKSISVYKGDNNSALTTLTVGSLLDTTGNTSINGSLTLMDGVTLDLGGIITLTDVLTFGSELTLSKDMITLLDSGDSVTLFAGVKGITGWDSEGTMAASVIFRNAEFAENGIYDSHVVSYKGGVVSIHSIPEPTTATLSLLALAGLAARRRRK